MRILFRSCILFHFYIKPQPLIISRSQQSVVSYSISTSNHNENLHCMFFPKVVSYSISTSNHNTCIVVLTWLTVVSYSISTSNHNAYRFAISAGLLYLIPFLHQTTTINRLLMIIISCILFHFYIKPQHLVLSTIPSPVVSYSISTSNHNFFMPALSTHRLYLIPFLHQTTTKNIKLKMICMLYLIPFLHQTTTPPR